MIIAGNTQAGGNGGSNFVPGPNGYLRYGLAEDDAYVNHGMGPLTTTGSSATPAYSTGSTVLPYLLRRQQTAANSNANIVVSMRQDTDDAIVRSNAGSAQMMGFQVKFWSGWQATAGDSRAFIGLRSGGGAIAGTVDPSSLTNILAFAKDSADSNMMVMHNDGSGTATEVDTGIAWNTVVGKAYQFLITQELGGGDVTFSVLDLDTEVVFSTVASTDLPALDTLLYWQHHHSNGPTAAAVTGSIWHAMLALNFPLMGASA